MVAILHYIITQIENERIINLLSNWKIKVNYKKQCKFQRAYHNQLLKIFKNILSNYTYTSPVSSLTEQLDGIPLPYYSFPNWYFRSRYYIDPPYLD